MLTKNKIIIILAIATVVLCIFSLSLGGADISWQEIVKFASGSKIDEIKETILLEIRLPRVIMAFLIGMLLASSGVVVQSVFLNPLADPYIIGIASAATFGAVVAYLLKLPDFYYGIFAFISAAVLSVVIFKLSKKQIYRHAFNHRYCVFVVFRRIYELCDLPHRRGQLQDRSVDDGLRRLGKLG